MSAGWARSKAACSIEKPVAGVCRSAALGAHILCAKPAVPEFSPLFPRMRAPLGFEIAPVGVFIRQLTQQGKNQPAEAFHTSSGLKRDSTNGASTTRADLVPFKMPIQMRSEST